MFEGENITLDIPKEGLLLESGWTITPHAHPRVNLSSLHPEARKLHSATLSCCLS